MSRDKLRLEMRKLSRQDKREVEQRERKHRARLEEQGYRSHVLVDQGGYFAIVMVEDPTTGRTGLLLPDGSVRWTDQTLGPGALADATVTKVSVDRK